MSMRVKVAGLLLGVAAVAALVAGGATGAGSKVPGINGVYSNDIAPGQVKAVDLAQPRFAALKPINGWAVYSGTTTRPPKIAINGFGQVIMRGTIRRASGGSLNPFVIPAKYRPGRAIFVAVPMHDNLVGQLQILANGVATLQPPPGAAPGTMTSLEGVTYDK